MQPGPYLRQGALCGLILVGGIQFNGMHAGTVAVRYGNSVDHQLTTAA
jgi:hypothetical protein